MDSSEWEPFFHPPCADAVPRLIVIDGCNIARSSCGPGRDNVNCAGLMAVIRWLIVRRFEVVAFLPVIYNNNYNFNAANVHLLPKLEELGVVTFTPARTARGDRKAFINYDDLYVAGLAQRHGGCVLSGDRFKDIIAQPNYSDLHTVLRDRRMDVRFRRLSHDFVNSGPDRYCKSVPELCLRVTTDCHPNVIARKLYAGPFDEDISKVTLRRNTWTLERNNQLIAEIDNLFDELCERIGVRPVDLPYPPHAHFRERAPPNIRSRGTRRRTEQPVSSDAATAPLTEPTVIVNENGSGEPARMIVSATRRSSVPEVDLLSMTVEELQAFLNSPKGVPQGVSGDTVPNVDVGDEEIEHQYVWTSEEDTSTSNSSRGDRPILSLDELPPIPEDLDAPVITGYPAHAIIASTDDDPIFAQLVSAFPEEVVRRVLRDNVSRNIGILAEICSELI